MRRIIAIIMTVMMLTAMLVTPVSASDAVNVMVQTADGLYKAGDEVTLEVSIENEDLLDLFHGIDWEIEYDETRLELKDFITSFSYSPRPGQTISSDYLYPLSVYPNAGEAKIIAAGAEPFNYYGTIFYIVFTVKDSVPKGFANVTINNIETAKYVGKDPLTGNDKYEDVKLNIITGGVDVDGIETVDVTYDLNGGTPADDVTYNTTANVGDDIILPAAPAKDGYVFMGWSFGSDVYLPEDKYMVSGVTAFSALWEKDANSDNVPDIYQKKVTFKVENGTWADGSTNDIVNCLTLVNENDEWDESGTATLEAPEGMIANNGYKAGAWDAVPPEVYTGVAEEVYTYSFKKAASVIQPVVAAYKVIHYKQQADGSYVIADEDFPLYGKIGETVEATTKDYENYHISTDNDKAVMVGKVVLPTTADDILTLKVYYDIDENVEDKPGETTQTPGETPGGETPGETTQTPGETPGGETPGETNIPSVGGSIGWDAIEDEVVASQPNETIVVEMNGAVEVPSQIIEHIANNKTEVEFNMEEGISWILKGSDIPEDTTIATVNLGITTDTSEFEETIPKDVVDKIECEDNVQIELSHNGDFGFEINLSIQIGTGKAGKWANLYYYNPISAVMEFVSSCIIDDEGKARLPFNHASNYLVAVDTVNHQENSGETTQTPGETTQTPGETTQTPGETTQTPGETTQTPGETTQTPGETTQTPGETTQTPGETTQTPGETTQTPGETTQTPGETTQTPGETTQTPGETTQTPGETTQTPGETTQTPGETTQTPGETTQTPGETTQTPGETTQTPGETTQTPGETTQTPGETTQTPGETTQTPGETTQTPGETTQTPGETTQTPGETTQTPGETTQTPGETTQTPGETTQTPGETTQTPGETTQTPGETTQTPGETTQTPGETTQTPGETTQTPGETTQTPGETTQTPGETPDGPGEITVPVTGITLDRETLTLTVGDNAVTLVATVTPDNATDKTVTWTTSDATVATVDANGEVTAVAAGTATITATAGDESATCVVTVNNPAPPTVEVTGITLDRETLTLTVGDNAVTLVATVTPDNATDKTVTWTTSDATVATVDANGEVTAVASGTATITATAGGVSASCVVTVNNPAPPTVAVTGVALDKTAVTIVAGNTETLVATVTPDNATDKTVTWTTSDATVATVDANGEVTAVAAGTATITATTVDGGFTAECEVTVTQPVTGVSLNKNTTTLIVGATETLVATVTPDNATDKAVTWTTSDATVATVDANGEVTAVASGTATITATAGGISATCVVTVNVNSRPSYSGGGVSNTNTKYYSVGKTNTKNGTVSVSKGKAEQGKTVTVTATPDEGYVVDTIIVIDENGNEIEVTLTEDGKYTFEMPAGEVDIKVTFKEEGEVEDGEITTEFGDVADTDYYYDAVKWAAEKGITKGTSKETFSPMIGCTRAEIVTFLWRVAGSPEQENTDLAFTDVDKDAYYYEAVLWAVENGITQGTSETTFSPDMVCSRAQMVTFLYRYSKMPEVTGESAFDDVDSADYFNNAVIWAENNGITQGTSETTFSPDMMCNRAQMVTFLYRFLAE